MNLTNITDTTNDVIDLEHWKPKVEVRYIPIPGLYDDIRYLIKNNWQDENEARLLYQIRGEVWDKLKEDNIIPKDVVDNIERKYKRL